VKVLAAIVVPPTVSASGAVNAAVRLSLALKNHVSIELGSMAPLPPEAENLTVVPVKTHNTLDMAGGLVAQRYRTQFHRSDLSQSVRAGRYDIVHLHNPVPALELRRVARSCLTTGTPYVMHTHGLVEVTSGVKAFGLPRYLGLPWRILVEDPVRFVFRRAARVFALSPADLPILERLGCSPDAIELVTNGVDLPTDQAALRSRMPLVCKRYGIPWPRPDDRVTCFYLGNHIPNKGLHILLEAFAQTSAPFTLVVGGKKREWIDYESYRRKSRPEQQFIFTDLLPEDDIGVLYQYADLFVFPSLADTLPLVILDAMAHGLAVLSTRIGGIPFQVDADSGVLVAPGDASALRSAFESLASSPEKLAAMGRHARDRVSREFDWALSAEKAYAAYCDVSGRTPG
jgi:starch synthase